MIKKTVFAGGCFWGLQDLIRKQLGVVRTRVGYTGGKVIDPTYTNHEGHAEAVEIEYDTEKTSYKSCWTFSFKSTTRPPQTSKATTEALLTVQLFFMATRRKGKKPRILLIL